MFNNQRLVLQYARTSFAPVISAMNITIDAAVGTASEPRQIEIATKVWAISGMQIGMSRTYLIGLRGSHSLCLI